MYMPHSSNPLNDHAVMSAYVPLLEHADPPVYSRAALGLPQHAVILANFNNPYKVDSVGVRAWAAALRGAGTGVIWMPEWEGLQSNAQLMRQLLLQEGVGWNAVVTTPLMPRDNHLLGRQLSDVRHPPFPPPPPPLSLLYGIERFILPFAHVIGAATSCTSPLGPLRLRSTPPHSTATAPLRRVCGRRCRLRLCLATASAIVWVQPFLLQPVKRRLLPATSTSISY
jgi:hypothetical protein